MLLIRMAIDKALMNEQRELWYMYAYDKMLPTEIALKLKLNKSTISRRLQVIEKKISKWCKEHQEVYEALKEAESHESEGC
jgi:DNA-directed RNA polymerase specialized sigma24 family protein